MYWTWHTVTPQSRSATYCWNNPLAHFIDWQARVSEQDPRCFFQRLKASKHIFQHPRLKSWELSIGIEKFPTAPGLVLTATGGWVVFHWFAGIVSIQNRIVTVMIWACLYSDTGFSKITTSLSPRVLHIESGEALCCNSLCFLAWTNMFRLLVKCITNKSQVLWAPHGGTGWARFICF